MRYSNEIEVKEVLGIESWRNLSKDTFLRFLAAIPEIDSEVALQLVGQIPEVTAFAKLAIDDAASAFDGLVASNASSMEMVHKIDLAVLATLRSELDRDLSSEERLRVLDEIRDVHERAHLKDTENKRFLSEQLDKRLGVTLAAALTVAGVVFAATKSGSKVGVNVGRLLAA
ncbi:hypothetical protein [Nocardioides sp.]|uniref:hypothetical protein n=1 Tax=Nocardioides sp. TaxID=35761 RepID=UPI00263449DF|nr:hypothetical protein [Nocardioides sp.]